MTIIRETPMRTLHQHVATVRAGRWVCALQACGTDLGVAIAPRRKAAGRAGGDDAEVATEREAQATIGD